MSKDLNFTFFLLFCVVLIQAVLICEIFSWKISAVLVEIFVIFTALFLIIFIARKTKIIYKERHNLTKTFFDDCMHELKTPLGVAMINLEMLETKNRHTHRIKSALKQMRVTYEDVEYFIKNERVNFQAIKLDFSEFLIERIKFSSVMANVKNIEIFSEISPGVEVFISEIELTRLIDNTINNAIKYTGVGGKIEISLKTDGEFAIFSVKDNGIGIKDTAKIWQRYEREDATMGGFGLGLAIVLAICNKYEILKFVSSTYGKGSIFSYKIPLFKEKILDKISN